MRAPPFIAITKHGWVLDVEDSQENHAFFSRFKETLKKRFGQLDIWITSQLVDVI